MDKIYIGNILISFTRKNIKNINIRVSRTDGQVKVSAPLFMSMRRVEKFILQKEDWIRKAQKSAVDKSLEKNETLQKIIREKMEVASLTEAQAKKQLADELLEISKPIFKKWESITGLKPKKIVVRWAKTVWGTCNKQSGRIMLSGMLIAYDEKYLDYVILHELAHLKYANHGQNFKDYMSRYLPNWKTLRKELNG